MTKRPTISDLASAAGVSVSTIDRILNKRDVVQQSTIAHVLNVARRLGFRAAPLLHTRLMENAPDHSFGFLLNRRDRVLYAKLASLLEERVSRSEIIRGKAIIHYLDDISPHAVAHALQHLARGCDAVAGVMVDGLPVRAAINELAALNIPVWTMLSDVHSSTRVGFVGSDPDKLGRGLGWFLKSLCPQRGRVALLIGSSAYESHRGYEAGLRRFLAAEGSHLDILPTQQTEERDDIAAEKVKRVLASETDLVSVVVAGGGIDGAMLALRKANLKRKILLFGTELSDSTDTGLQRGQIDAVLSHPAEFVVERVVRAMERHMVFGQADMPEFDYVPIEIRIKETV